MPSNAEYDQYLTEALVAAITGEPAGSSVVATDSQVVDHLVDLVNGIPFLRDPVWEDCYRGAVGNLMATSLPQESVVCPSSVSGGSLAMFSYPDEGEYVDYRNAFFHGINRTEPANNVKTLASKVNAATNDAFWRDYGVAILTDAIQESAAVQINKSMLEDDLERFHDELKPSLTATYGAVFEEGYSPTADPLRVIRNAGEAAEAAALLDRSIQNGFFTANVNGVTNSPPDGPPAATWFLFNLWVALKALGHEDVDGAIARYQEPDVGLIISWEIGPQSWWNGGYSSWHRPFAGSDVIAPAQDSIDHEMQIMVVFFDAFHRPLDPIPDPWPNGYGHSFTELGVRSYYYNGSSSRNDYANAMTERMKGAAEKD